MTARADSSHDAERQGVARFSASVDPVLLKEFDQTQRIKALAEKLSSCRGVKQSKIAILKN